MFSRGGASASGAMVSMEIDMANRTTDTTAVLTPTKTQLAFRGQLPAATRGCQHRVTDVRDGLCAVGLAVSEKSHAVFLDRRIVEKARLLSSAFPACDVNGGSDTEWRLFGQDVYVLLRNI
ncbi:hypothetical protein MRX96_058563 [Rhipicephalus microplus]